MARRGPRGSGEDTRSAILDAARRAFGSHGYDRTTIRGIAGDAGVDPALIHHYFGTKADLFGDAMALPFRPADAVPTILDGDPETVGESLARLFFTAWEMPATRDALLGQLRHSMVTGDQPAIAGFLTDEIIDRLAARMDGDDRALRVEMAVAQLIGIALLRYVIRLEPIASTPIETLIAEIAPGLQQRLAARSSPQ